MFSGYRSVPCKPVPTDLRPKFTCPGWLAKKLYGHDAAMGAISLVFHTV